MPHPRDPNLETAHLASQISMQRSREDPQPSLRPDPGQSLLFQVALTRSHVHP